MLPDNWSDEGKAQWTERQLLAEKRAFEVRAGWVGVGIAIVAVLLLANAQSSLVGLLGWGALAVGGALALNLRKPQP